MITNDEIELRPIDISDTDNILRWRNSESVKNNFFIQDEITREQHLNWLETKVKAGKVYQFIIVDKNSKHDIGTVYLRDVDNHNKKAEFGIYIGEPNYRGRGLGNQATELICEFAFNEAGLNRVFLRVFEFNEKAINTYLKCNFQIEGTLRDDIYANEKFNNVVIMGRLAK